MSPVGSRKSPRRVSRSRALHGTRRAKAGSVGTTANTRRHALVVGIGASAGGLEALKAFFGAMPPKSGFVFIVVVHLDPSHDSLLPELLAKATTLTVEQARDKAPLEADHVYIIPPNRTLTVDQRILHVEEVVDRRLLRGSIDRFFRSLAAAHGANAVGIVLSGTGTEGTLGARAIKAEGGVVMAQTPESASQPGMPASVIANGLADVVQPPDKMPRALLEYARDSHARRLTTPTSPETTPLDNLQPILAVLRARTKRDFRGYRKGTLRRRIERRMALQQIASVANYVDVLRSRPAEAHQLAKDLLIGVTSFFRDPSVFDELATSVLAGLVRDRETDAPIRVWVPGCATGEEAYSIAIVLAEQIAELGSACHVQIFATDLDEHALEIARSGTYPETISLDVSEPRLRRFFAHEDHRYTIVKSIRDSVTFAVQNLIADPAFSKLDLVSCRNVLIYLEPEVQEKLIELFHFALNPRGYLMLGSAEGIGALEDLFTPISKRHRIFRRVGAVTRPPIAIPAALRSLPGAGRGSAKATEAPTTATLADQELLDHFAPAAVVVRDNGQIVRFYGAMDRYIHLPSGDATLDVLALVQDDLKPALREALYDAVLHNHRRVVEGIEIKRGQADAALRVTIQPLIRPAAADQLWLIIFEEQPAPSRLPARRGSPRQATRVRQLEAEIRATKKTQQQLVEQLESSNEELKVANEEILSMNEELQSTNEELVTSKEELQSMNEELSTLNAQLQDKVQELTVVNDDLANLLVSTDIVTVFLDTDLRIKRFTTAATRLLNLLRTDVNRPIQHITTNLVDVDLSQDARAVLANGTPVEREASAQDGTQYYLRVLPYRSSEERAILGVVVTLVDVTTLKKTAHELRAAQDQLQLLNQTLEQRVAERTKWLSLVHDVTRDIHDAPSWDEALHRVLRRICESECWQIGFVYVPDRDTADAIRPVVSLFSEERFQSFHAASEKRVYKRGQSLPGRVYGEGATIWRNDPKQLRELLPLRGEAATQAGLRAAAALPVRFGRDVIAVLELFSDQSHEPSDLLDNLMNDVSTQIGEVLERERATAEMADLVWREQQGLLHTLHDSLGQTLTGLGMLSTGLRQRLHATNGPAAESAQQVAEQAQVALEQVRQLARGLFPVEIDPTGLMPALRELASTAETIHQIRVQAVGEVPNSVRDSRVATQLYRIAQEAVTNAVKHAKARTVQIELSSTPGLARLRIVDDGAGIRKSGSKSDGLGLRIMRYRATSIGAILSIDPGPDGGTVVTCSLRETPVPAEMDANP